MVAVNAAIRLERPLLVKGEPGTGKTELARQVAAAPRTRSHRMERQIHDQGAAGPLRIRCRLAAARQPARRRSASMTSRTISARASSGMPSTAPQKGRAADRRDRQGRYRVPERPAAGTRPHGVPRLRDRRDDPRRCPADRHHHLQQREGTAGRLPAPLLLPLHPLSRCRYAGAHRRGALSRHQEDGCCRRRSPGSSRSATCRA